MEFVGVDQNQVLKVRMTGAFPGCPIIADHPPRKESK